MSRRTIIVTCAAAWVLLTCGAADASAGGLEAERTASVFHSYEFEPVADTPAPEGFKPFYISHYGRHGSRRLTGTFVSDTLAVLEAAEKGGGLTDAGRALLADVRKIAAVHDGMIGQLAGRGAEEHRLLARRMAARFLEVFARGGLVRCQSAVFHRVLISQANFTIALKDAMPGLDFDFTTGDKYQMLLNGPKWSHEEAGKDGEIHAAVNALARSLVDPAPLVKRIFAADGAAANPLKFARDLFAVASICQCLRSELESFDIYRYFTPDETGALSHALEAEHFADMAASEEFGEIPLRGTRALACDFVKRADEAISAGTAVADLRFGHDSGLWPLAGLIGLEGPGERAPFADSWRKCPAWKWMPMAANLQMVFYRGAPSGDILVKVLYNEREMRIGGLEPVQWPYYRWRDLKERMVER